MSGGLGRSVNPVTLTNKHAQKNRVLDLHCEEKMSRDKRGKRERRGRRGREGGRGRGEREGGRGERERERERGERERERRERERERRERERGEERERGRGERERRVTGKTPAPPLSLEPEGSCPCMEGHLHHIPLRGGTGRREIGETEGW